MALPDGQQSVSIDNINQLMSSAFASIKSLQAQYNSAEVREQLQFMLGIYKSVNLLYFTVSELNNF